MELKPTDDWDEFESNARKYFNEHPEIASGEKEMPPEDQMYYNTIIEQCWNKNPLF